MSAPSALPPARPWARNPSDELKKRLHGACSTGADCPRRQAFYFDYRHRRPLLRPGPFLPPALPRPMQDAITTSSISRRQGSLLGRFLNRRLEQYFAAEELRSEPGRQPILVQRFGEHQGKPLLKPCLLGYQPVRASKCTRPSVDAACIRRPRLTLPPLRHYGHCGRLHLDSRQSGASTVSRRTFTNSLGVPIRSHCAVGFQAMRRWPPPSFGPDAGERLGVLLDYYSAPVWGTDFTPPPFLRGILSLRCSRSQPASPAPKKVAQPEGTSEPPSSPSGAL